MDFSVMLRVLLQLFLLLVLGYFLYRTHILDKKTNRGLSSLIVNVTNPCLMLGSLASTGDVAKEDALRLVIFGFLFYVVMIAAAFVLVRLFCFSREKRGTVEDLIIFANAGFMAIPVEQSLFGDIAVFCIVLVNLPFNFLMYTYGVYLLQASAAAMAGEKSPSSGPAEAVPSEQTGRKASPWKKLLSPGILSSLLTLVLFFAGVRLPSFLSETLEYVGDITPALSMILMGSILAEYPLKSCFSDVRLDLVLAVKLFLIPFLSYLLSMVFFPNSEILRGVCILTYAMPCGTMNVMMASVYHGDTRTASAGVVFSTMLSMLTIPLVYFLFVN